jgi:3-oxoacyl-[acyl-carrier protein] reductase
MDVMDRGSIDTAAREARRALGPLSLLINNAGINRLGDFDSLVDGDGNPMLAPVLKGPFGCAQAFLPLLAETKNGSIVHVGLMDGDEGTTPAGLIALGEAIARFGGPLNVRSNVIAAALITSDMAAPSEEAVQDTILKRCGTEREVADAVVFLASDASTYITAQTLNVNGGWYC